MRLFPIKMCIEFKQSKNLKNTANIRHGFFTKNGGVSTGVYESLNCSPSSDDLLDNVIENRRRVMAALGKTLEDNGAKIFGLYQIHSKKVYNITKDMANDEFRKGDAMVTNQAGVFLSVLGADCTPVLFSNSDGSVVGAAHAGWKGAVTGIVESVVEEMCRLGAKREEITACIGPTIHQSSYEVQQDFIDQLNSLSSISAGQFLQENQGRFYFNLPAYLLEQCRYSKIKAEDIGMDTYALKDEFFSYRRNTHESLEDYGRQISVIGIV